MTVKNINPTLVSSVITNQPINKRERGRVMNKLPKRINVTKVVSYDVDKIVGDIKDMGREEEITLESILDYIDGWVQEDFGSEHELIFADENGEELQ
jgi:hypothetical protein